MSLEGDIYQALSTSGTLTALVSSRIYMLTMRQSGAWPAVVVRRSAGERFLTYDGFAGLENPHIDITMYTQYTDERISLTDAVLDALSSSTAFTMVADTSPDDDYDDAFQVYTRSMDISVWYSS
jgi:hypothetical protein